MAICTENMATNVHYITARLLKLSASPLNMLNFILNVIATTPNTTYRVCYQQAITYRIICSFTDPVVYV